MPEPVLDYRATSRYPVWAKRLFLASLPLLIGCLGGPIYSCAFMKFAQAREGKIYLDFARDAALYRTNIEDIPGIVATTGTALSCLLLLGMAITGRISPPVGLFIFAYPVIWFTAMFALGLISFAAFI